MSWHWFQGVLPHRHELIQIVQIKICEYVYIDVCIVHIYIYLCDDVYIMFIFCHVH